MFILNLDYKHGWILWLNLQALAHLKSLANTALPTGSGCRLTTGLARPHIHAEAERLLLIARPTNPPLLAPRSYARRLHWKNVRIHSDVLTMVGGFHRSLPLWDCKQVASFLTSHPRWNPLTPGSKAKESCNEVQ